MPMRCWLPIYKSTTNRHKQQLIIVTSCNPQEGKTTLAINLSIALANSGFNVLLIDTDMRKPEKAKRLYQNVQMGLSDYINGRIELSEAIIKTNINHFSYLASGRHDPNPIALLSSSRFEGLVEKIRKDQALDYVIFDTPAPDKCCRRGPGCVKRRCCFDCSEDGLYKNTGLKTSQRAARTDECNDPGRRPQ